MSVSIAKNLMMGMGIETKHIKYIAAALSKRFQSAMEIVGAFRCKSDHENSGNAQILVVTNLFVAVYTRVKSGKDGLRQINIASIKKIATNEDASSAQGPAFSPNLVINAEQASLRVRLLKGELAGVSELINSLREKSEKTSLSMSAVGPITPIASPTLARTGGIGFSARMPGRQIAKKFAIAILGIAFAFGLHQIYYSLFTEYGAIKARHGDYNAALRNFDSQSAYAYLSTDTQSVAAEKSWESFVRSRPVQSRSRVVDIVLMSDQVTAKVAVTDVYHGDQLDYSQTWVKEKDDKWYRHWAADNPRADIVQKKSNISSESDAENSVGFEIVDAVYKWEASKSAFDLTKLLVVPMLKFSVLNIGNQPITKLSFNVQFVENDSSKIFSSVREYAIRASDIALDPGVTSESYFMKSSIGYDAAGMNSDAVAILVKRKIREVTPRLYFKANSGDKWQLYKIDWIR